MCNLIAQKCNQGSNFFKPLMYAAAFAFCASIRGAYRSLFSLLEPLPFAPEIRFFHAGIDEVPRQGGVFIKLLVDETIYIAFEKFGCFFPAAVFRSIADEFSQRFIATGKYALQAGLKWIVAGKGNALVFFGQPFDLGKNVLEFFFRRHCSPLQWSPRFGHKAAGTEGYAHELLFLFTLTALTGLINFLKHESQFIVVISSLTGQPTMT